MTTRDNLLPGPLRAQVVHAMYDDAERLGWPTLSLPDRTKTFNSWIEDERVGKILTRFMNPEQARSWIKDGPMKEYSDAMRGAGRFADFGRQGGTGPQDVVRHALGEDAQVVDGTVGNKPLHCLASIGDSVAYLAWGDSKNFKSLLWAALRSSVNDGHPAHIVVMQPPGVVIPAETLQEQQDLSKRCDLTLHHMREVLGSVGGTS